MTVQQFRWRPYADLPAEHHPEATVYLRWTAPAPMMYMSYVEWCYTDMSRGCSVLCRAYHIPLPPIIISGCTTTTTSKLIRCTRGSHSLIFGIRVWSVPSHLLHLCMARVAQPHTYHSSIRSHVDTLSTPSTGQRRLPSREHSFPHRNW